MSVSTKAHESLSVSLLCNVGQYLVLIAEDVVVDVVLLDALRRQDEGLHEPSHRLPVVGKFAADLKQRWD